jgi:hypothetical protein
MQIPLKQTLCATFVVTALLLPIAGHATTYYVAPTGNDASTCTQAKSASTPKKTIPAGVKCLSGGDTLIVKAGIYVNQEIRNPPAGTASAYTVIKGDPSGPRPIMRPALTSQRGLHCTNGAACHHIELRHFEIDRPYECAKLYGSSALGYPHHLKIIDNFCHDTKANGIIMFSSYTGFVGGDHLIQGNEFSHCGIGTPHYTAGMNTIYNPGNRSIVERNKFHDGSQGVGIWECGGPDNRQSCAATPHEIRNVIIRNNKFYRMGRTDLNPWSSGASLYSGIHVSVTGGGHQIYNNIVYDSGNTSIFRGILVAMRGSQAQRDASAPVHLYNNTIYNLKHASAFAVWVRQDGGPHPVRNNIAYLAGKGLSGGAQSNNLTQNPSFKNGAIADFQLLSGSAAINKGVILSQVPTDFAGGRRPQGTSHDVGAYEFGTTSTLAAPTSLSAQ